MKSHAVSIGTALAFIAGIGVAPAQTLPATSVDGLVSAAKNAAGLEWPGTFLRLCVVPPPAAPGGAESKRERAWRVPAGGRWAAWRALPRGSPIV